MANDGSEKPKAPFEVSIGKQTDAAFGDVIRGLLKKPSEAVGDLLADSIGIVGDRIKRKREKNAQLGLEEVRKKLDADGVDIRDIAPPKEEEMYLLLNGFSLTDDENVRDMWAGLFAKALEPNSEVQVERPFIRVLEALTPMDAKIIDLLAFIQRVEGELQKKIRVLQPKEQKLTAEEAKEVWRSVNQKTLSLRDDAIRSIKDKAENYGLLDIELSGWAENLIRQGVIERTPIQQRSNLSRLNVSRFDEGEIFRALDEMRRQIEVTQKMAAQSSVTPEKIFSQNAFSSQLNIEVRLTSFGRRLAEACGLL